MNQIVAFIGHQFEVAAHGLNKLCVARNSERESKPVVRPFLFRNLYTSILQDLSSVFLDQVAEHLLVDALGLLLEVRCVVGWSACVLVFGEQKLQELLYLLEDDEIAAYAAQNFI